MQKPTQQFKQIPVLLLLIAFFLGIKPVIAETTGTEEGHPTHDAVDWPGMYLGFFPCADCKGIKTTLALNKNGSYMIMSQYVGKSEREFVEKGKFDWSDKPNIIVLNPKKGGTEKQYFMVEQDSLTKLDQNGDLIGGQHADRYILRRKDVISAPAEHSGH